MKKKCLQRDCVQDIIGNVLYYAQYDVLFSTRNKLNVLATMSDTKELCNPQNICLQIGMVAPSDGRNVTKVREFQRIKETPGNRLNTDIF